MVREVDGTFVLAARTSWMESVHLCHHLVWCDVALSGSRTENNNADLIVWLYGNRRRQGDETESLGSWRTNKKSMFMRRKLNYEFDSPTLAVTSCRVVRISVMLYRAFLVAVRSAHNPLDKTNKCAPPKPPIWRRLHREQSTTSLCAIIVCWLTHQSFIWQTLKRMAKRVTPTIGRHQNFAQVPLNRT